MMTTVKRTRRALQTWGRAAATALTMLRSDCRRPKMRIWRGHTPQSGIAARPGGQESHHSSHVTVRKGQQCLQI